MRYRKNLSINLWNMLLQVKEICSRICCFLKKIQQLMFPQKLRNFIVHLFQTFVAMKNAPFCPWYQIHAVKQKSWSYSTVLGIFLIKQKKTSYFQQINQSNFTKWKLDCDKAHNFIEFLFSSDAIQEVAYGTTILKFNELEF